MNYVSQCQVSLGLDTCMKFCSFGTRNLYNGTKSINWSHVHVS
jgi:hypothetical protein